MAPSKPFSDDEVNPRGDVYLFISGRLGCTEFRARWRMLQHVPAALLQYAALRNTLLDRIAAALREDTRVVGAWLVGSFGRGQADAWSDLDLEVAIVDEQLASFLDDRPALFTRV